MKLENLVELTEQELMQEATKQKSRVNAFRVIIGLMFVASIYSTFRKGFSTSLVLPICFLPLLISIEKQNKALQMEIQSRQSS
jgi:hypothetical protein